MPIIHLKHMINLRSLRSVVSIYAFILVVWGFYRFLFKLPETVEELILKPIIWLVPLWWVLRKSGMAAPADRVPPKASAVAQTLKSVGWTTNNLFKSIYLAIGLGVLFAAQGALVNSIKYGGSFNFLSLELSPYMFLGALLVSLATAVTEETVFRGFIFSRLWKVLDNEWRANLVSSTGWALVHLPVTIFVFKYDPIQIITFLLLTFLFGVASAFVFARTGSVVSSVLLHVFWEWPIILFR